MLIGHYTVSLVLISVLVAILASYTTLDLAGRIASASGRTRAMWVCGGGLSMGVGIWSMHFIGMLAFSLPIPLAYDVALTSLTLVMGIFSSGIALWLVSHDRVPVVNILFGALIMGLGTCAMHYTGMAAMRMQPGIDYDSTRVGLSLVIAVAASAAALCIAVHLRKQSPYVRLARGGAAVVMGFAILGMHYTAMSAANFPDGSFCGALGSGLQPNGLDKLVLVTSLCVLGITLLTSVLDARMAARTAQLSQSLKQANRELTQLALHDNLTGLPNRNLLAERIDEAMRKVDSRGGMLAVMFLDLDGFKPVNDAFGHHVGDQLLRAVALRMRENFHRHDTLARIGGDEFVLLVELDSAEEAVGVATRQVTLVSQPFNVQDHELQVTVSVGISLYPGNGLTQQELLMNADAAMYHAKNAGKNGYSFFDASMNTNARHQLQLQQDLRVALREKQFCLHYQPTYSAGTRQAIGAEALLRWDHPVQGLLMPETFIGLAEQSGLIIAIGNWALNEACRQMKIWYENGYTDWRVAVNLSALQFGHAALTDTVAAALATHQLPANCLTLEITETTAMSDADASMTVLRRLADMGVDLSIDDFGTGYSSLMYLKRLPANELKIDRGFVRDLEHDIDDAAIVSAIVALGQALNMRIVAEGVETTSQQNFLTRLGCDSLQGHLLGHPLPADRFMADIEAVRDRLSERTD